MQEEDRLLLAQIEDRIRSCQDQYALTHTAFLDMRQAALAEKLARDLKARFSLFGGYDDAERRIMAFLPDYMDEAQLAEGDDCPLSLLKVSSPKGSRQLTHRDYLGSILGLGIKREVVGDIIVRPDGADILILREMEDFLLSEYTKAGRNNLTVRTAPLSELDLGEIRTEDAHDTVASLRLDSVVGSAFRLARGKAQEAVRAGLVYKNGMQCLKPDAEVSEGDKIVLRGKGKAVLKEIGGMSRKDRINITITRYM
ncbi:MAG: RNA-binding protein [Firmicutes bacterium]|nr:RNA-binding protein [Bacillota bacterium]